MLTSKRMRDHQLIENQRHLAEWVRGARGPLDLAVTFWGEGAVEALGLEKSRPVRVLLELQSGGTNPDEVRRLMKLAHVQVKQMARLHAKAYISKRSVLIGSTNASANGLGSEGSESTRWHELVVRTNDPFVVRDTKQWFEEKWAAGQSVKPSHLDQAEREWKERQKIRPKVGSSAKDILSAALDKPNEYRNRGLFVVVSTADWDKKGYADAASFKEKTGQEALGWQGWTSIPRDATLICFGDYKDEGFQWDDPKICYSPREINQFRSLFLVSAVKLKNGLKPGDIRRWREALESVKAKISKKRWNADNGMCLDLGDFADRVLAP